MSSATQDIDISIRIVADKREAKAVCEAIRKLMWSLEEEESVKMTAFMTRINEEDADKQEKRAAR